MKKYRVLDGKVFTAGSPRELAEALWKSQFIPPDTLEEWMDGSAERAHMWNEAVIRTDTVEHHVEDLMANGFIEAIDE